MQVQEVQQKRKYKFGFLLCLDSMPSVSAAAATADGDGGGVKAIQYLEHIFWVKINFRAASEGATLPFEI